MKLSTKNYKHFIKNIHSSTARMIYTKAMNVVLYLDSNIKFPSLSKIVLIIMNYQFRENWANRKELR